LKLLVLLVLLHQSATNLDDTLKWLANFSLTHGFSRGHDAEKTHINAFIPINGCEVRVEHEYLASFSKFLSRKETILLGDFDPEKVKIVLNMRDQDENDVYTVEIEHSDSSRTIQAAAEMKDGTKKTVFIAADFFRLDSVESATRFKNGLTHAIELCGGKPAPF
jgi:hypothetical protein